MKTYIVDLTNAKQELRNNFFSTFVYDHTACYIGTHLYLVADDHFLDWADYQKFPTDIITEVTIKPLD